MRWQGVLGSCASDLTWEFSPGLWASVCLEDLGAILVTVLSVSCVGHLGASYLLHSSTVPCVMKMLSACLEEQRGQRTDGFVSEADRQPTTRVHCVSALSQSQARFHQAFTIPSISPARWNWNGFSTEERAQTTMVREAPLPARADTARYHGDPLGILSCCLCKLF